MGGSAIRTPTGESRTDDVRDVPPRVLLALTDVFGHGGIQRFNRTFLTALDRLGCESESLSLNDDAGPVRRLDEARGASVIGFGHGKLAFSTALGAKLARPAYDALVIGHVHFARLVAALRVMPGRSLPPRVLLIAHGLEVWQSIRGHTRRSLARVTDIVSVSSYTQQKIVEQAPELASKRLHIFPNALAETWVDRAAGLRSSGAPPLARKPFILSVTRLGASERTKGVVTTLEALSMSTFRDLGYVVAGSGDDVPFLRNVAERLGISERVKFVGSLTDEELMALYRECEAFVLPSGQEGFGIVFLEAMYFGAPVIAAREKGAVDVVRDDRNGLLVDFGDVLALRAAIDRVVAMPSVADRLRLAGKALVSGDGEFTFSAFTRRAGELLGRAS